MRNSLLSTSIILPAFLGLGAALAGSTQGCTSVTNTTAIQCTSESECLSLGPEFAGTTCEPTTKTCKKLVDEIGKCEKNQECLDRANGAPSICRKSDKKCVLLTTPECPTVLTKKGNVDLANDNVIVIGSMTPENHTELGTVMTRMVDLAQGEVNASFTKGLPPVSGSTASRPVAIVACREFGAGVEGLLRGANHLVKNVQIPLMIGPVDPANGGIVWSQVTNPNKVLAITPTSVTSITSSIPNPIAPTPIIWRLNFDDRAIVTVVREFIKNQLEPALIARGITPPIRVGEVFGGDGLGLSVHAQVQTLLKFNDMTVAENQAAGNYLAVNAGDNVDTLNNPNPEGKYGAAIAAMFQFKPHIILNNINPAQITRIYFPLEAAWPAGEFRPYHIGMQSFWNAFGPIFPFLTGRSFNPTIRQNGRFFAVQNFSSNAAPPFPVVSPQVQAFVARFNDRFPELKDSVSQRAQLAWALYDATYLAMYSIVAVRDKPVTGENLAATLPQFTQGLPITTYDLDSIDKAFGELKAGRSIDIQGLYGSMNFDPKIAAPTYGLEITCPNVDMTTGQTIGMKGSGFRYKVDNMAPFVTGLDGVDQVPTSALPCPPPPP